MRARPPNKVTRREAAAQPHSTCCDTCQRARLGYFVRRAAYRMDTPSLTPASDHKPRVFYGWRLVALSGFIMMLAHVPLFHAMGVWAVALEREFGWSRTQIGLALTFTRIEGGLMGPVEGYLTDRLGTRRMVIMGLFFLAAGFLLLSQVDGLWMFYTAYVVMAVGQGFGGWLPLMTMLNHWFVRRRASAIGWANVGSRLGALFLVPTIAWAIDPDSERLGWRMTALLLAVFTLVVAVPLARLIRDRPQDSGLLPDGGPLPRTDAARGPATSQPISPAPHTDLTAAQALRTSAFWLISFGHGFTSMVLLAIMAHLGLLMEDAGFSVQTTAWLVSVYTAVSMVFQLVGGYIGDRMPKRIALFIFSTLQAAGVVVLTFSTSTPMLVLFAVLFGIGFGGRNPLTVAIRGDYFGQTSFGKILGLSTVPMNILMLVAPPFAGWMRDVRGDYILAFWVLAGCSFLGGLCFLFARNPRPAPSPSAR